MICQVHGMTTIGTSKDRKHQRDLSWAVSKIAQLKNGVPQSRNAIDFPDSPVPALATRGTIL